MIASSNFPTSVQYTSILLGEPHKVGSSPYANPAALPTFTVDPLNANAPLPASFEMQTSRTGVMLSKFTNEYVAAARERLIARPASLWYNTDEKECQISRSTDLAQFASTVTSYSSGGVIPESFTSEGTRYTCAQLVADTLPNFALPIPLTDGVFPFQGVMPLIEFRSRRSGMFVPRLTDAYVTSIYEYLILPACEALFWFNTDLLTFQFSTGSQLKRINSTNV